MVHYGKDLTPEDLLCVRLSVENCSKVWTSEGREVYLTNNTHIGCTFPELSTFTVLKRIQSIENAAEILSSFPGKALSFDEGNKAEVYAIITQHLTQLEDAAQMMAADAVTQGELKLVSDIQELTVQALPINSSLSGEATLSTVTTHVTIPWDTVRGNQTSGIACVATIVLKGSESGMDADHLGNKYKAKPRLVSDVLTISISGFKKGKLSTPVSLQFTQSESKDQTNVPICVYWASAANQSGWLSDGCTVQSSKGNRTVCSCNHLTSFAVLMAPTEIPDSQENILQKITYVGIAVSLFCLLLSLISFTLCRSSNNIRITLHTHLTLSLFLAEFLFVIHIDQVANEIACKIVAILLHYLFLACFAWMLLEGVQLYLMVVKVFHSRSLQRKYLYLTGYGLPLVIVVTTTAIDVNAYGTKTYCWLTLTSGFIWAFLAPVCAIIGINAVFFIITVWKLIGKFSMLSTDVPYFKKVRSFTCTAIAQLVLLGGTWIFGIFHITGDTIFMSYIFTILNSLQGLFIFILHCVLNKQVRSEILNTASKITKDSSIWKSSNPINTFLLTIWIPGHSSQAPTVLVSSTFQAQTDWWLSGLPPIGI
ncbi:adhesion G protein-coupled receptor E5-like [Chiloscyllium plagiosum]|uniref:adhesion G protein-coupled receptor E5-like n=1 Tax=Chiloscyllium plagiosum TaxID=36176 RepID=UPI001CB84AF2|nr:adhesion G protein-coupled receptor E5-like [Chiloscyllium plagiosum]